MAYYQTLGFVVVSMWSCQLTRERQVNSVLNTFIQERLEYHSELNQVGNIVPRDALYGGRTNNIKFHHRAEDPGSKIMYLDFTSLYPYELSRKEYPLGHPELIRDHFDTDMNFIGIVKCTVGWASWCVTDQDKQSYISDYEEHEDVLLDPEKVNFNPGRRFIAKIMLNSFWGKFAQRPNMDKTQIINEPAEYFDLLKDASKEVKDESMPSEDKVLIT